MSEKKNTNQKVDFEKLINQLKEVLVKLESGDLSLEESMKEFEKSGVDLGSVYRPALLDACDQVWSEHLDNMHTIQQGVHLVTTVGEKPEDAFTRRGFEQFERAIEAIRDRSVEEIVPQIIVGASILKRDRELAQTRVA